MSDINQFLNSEHFSLNKFLIFGEEPALIVKAKTHILLNENLKMVEKIYIDIDGEDFEECFSQAILANSLFNEKKIIFIKLKKNRLNKVLIENFKKINDTKTENLILVEIESLSKKVILKDIISILKSSFQIVECSINSNLDVIGFLKENLPYQVNNEKNINTLVRLYEGNFSLLVNDLKILELLDLEEEKDILNVFNDSGIKRSSKLIEHISKQEVHEAIEILESMRNIDRNSIGLLIWILARDCQALTALKEKNNNLRSLNIWDSQIKWYNTIANRVSLEQIKVSIKKLDEADKNLKGVISGDPWIKTKDVILALAT
tara:strand:+ start:585 stop:1541 length:957 start_codon:yes stop_codon:yes gene_type:complete